MAALLTPSVVLAHHDRLRRAARALCDTPDDADDLVQETYARVLVKRRLVDSGDAALPYLLRTLRNVHVSNLRVRDRRPRTAPLDAADARLVAPEASSPPARLLDRELFQAIAALPPPQRRIVAAVDIAGLSYSEAAAVLRTPIGTVMSRLYRARRRVAEATAA